MVVGQLLITPTVEIFSNYRPNRRNRLITIIMMRYGIFSMRWASASRGSARQTHRQTNTGENIFPRFRGDKKLSACSFAGSIENRFPPANFFYTSPWTLTYNVDQRTSAVNSFQWRYRLFSLSCACFVSQTNRVMAMTSWGLRYFVPFVGK